MPSCAGAQRALRQSAARMDAGHCRRAAAQARITRDSASNRPLDDWTALLGDVVVVTPLLDRLMHHGHLLRFQGKSWRLKEAAERAAKQPAIP